MARKRTIRFDLGIIREPTREPGGWDVLLHRTAGDDTFRGVYQARVLVDGTIIGITKKWMIDYPAFWYQIGKAFETQWAIDTRADTWLVGNGGSETAFRTRTGRRLLWCWNPGQDRHAYLDCDADMILTDEEARAALDY